MHAIRFRSLGLVHENNLSFALQAERAWLAPAKHAAIARDRDGVPIASRDRNHPLTMEGLDLPWRQLIRGVAVAELPRLPVTPREELACCCHGTAGVIPSCDRAHIAPTQSLDELGQGLGPSTAPQAQLAYDVVPPREDRAILDES